MEEKEALRFTLLAGLIWRLIRRWEETEGERERKGRLKTPSVRKCLEKERK